MLFLKIVVQIFSMLSTWVIARLDYSWYDKETSEFKIGRLGLFIVLSILLFISIAITILDEREKKGEIEERNSKITDLSCHAGLSGALMRLLGLIAATVLLGQNRANVRIKTCERSNSINPLTADCPCCI